MHRVFMSFMLRDGWYCQFLEADLQTRLRKKLTFRSEEKIKELVRRSGTVLDLEGEQFSIEVGEKHCR